MLPWFRLFWFQLIREKTLLLVFLALPLFFLLTISMSMGGSGSGFSRSLQIDVICLQDPQFCSERIAALRQVRFENQPALQIRLSTDADAAMRRLVLGQTAAVLHIEDTLPRLYLHPASALGPYAESFIRDAWVQKTLPPHYHWIAGSGGQNDFLYWIPGTLVFGAVFGGMVTALLLAGELRRQTFQRIFLAQAQPGKLIMGLWLCMIAVTALQCLLALGMTSLLNYHFPVPWYCIATGILCIAVSAGALSTAIGIATTALVATETTATMLSIGLLAPHAFFSGTFFPVPSPRLFTWQEQPFYSMDILVMNPVIRNLNETWVRGMEWNLGHTVNLLYTVIALLLLIIPAALGFYLRRLRN